MNKNPVPNAANAVTPAAAAAKPAAAATRTARATRTINAAPAKSSGPAKVVRVGRPPGAKTAAVKKAPAARAAKAAPANAVATAPTAATPLAARPAAAGKEKGRKAKLVRDSFTMPETEYAILGKAKKASLKAGFNVKKSELLRIGVALVDQLSMAQLQAALAALMPLKAGRPKKDK